MKWAYQIKYKLKAAFLLTGIIIVILVSNFSETNSFTNLDDSMTSIYNDRLKPATYLFEISSNLYRKRLLHDAAAQHTPAELNALAQKHNEGIAALVKNYETTYLTKEEREQWLTFKAHLHEYDALENTWLKTNANDKDAALAMHAQIDDRFNATMHNLDNLSRIQVGVGNDLQQSSHSIISANVLLSYLEMALLIVLGLFTLILLSTTDNALLKRQQNQVWN